MMKLLNITLVGLLIIMAIILIKYKPMYHVKIGNKEIGYIDEKQTINNYIEEIVNEKQNKNIAFIEIEEEPKVELQLASRDTHNCNEILKNEIDKNLCIEYTTYAITYNGNNIVYVSSMKEAEEIIENIKKDDNLKYTKDIGVLQVYSNNYSQIEAINSGEATSKIAKTIKNENNSKTVKVANMGGASLDNSKKTAVKKLGVSLSKPLTGVITSRYGGRRSPGGIGSTNHKGLDISAKNGKAIKAAASGTVKFAGYKGSLGNLVIIDNGNKIETYYGHCSKLYVKKGQKVKAGDQIAAVGQTGAATGPHLHFEVHLNGTPVNPQRYVYR